MKYLSRFYSIKLLLNYCILLACQLLELLHFVVLSSFMLSLRSVRLYFAFEKLIFDLGMLLYSEIFICI